MPQQKKITDYFSRSACEQQSFFKNLWPAGSKKYSRSVYNQGTGYGYRDREEVRVNTESNAKILTVITNCIVDPGEASCKITIDFRDDSCFASFKTNCDESIANLFAPNQLGYHKNTLESLKHFPNAHPVSYAVMLSNTERSKARDLMDKVIIAIHATDPLDIQTIKELHADFGFMKLTSTKNLIEMHDTIKQQLTSAGLSGGTFGLFARLSLINKIGKDMVKTIGEFLEPSDLNAITLTCKRAAKESKNEIRTEEAKITRQFK